MTIAGELGKEGERRAAQLLQSKGYTILAQNFRYRKAEIDIIAQQENTLVIVEVKTRSSTQFQELTETISKKKMKLMIGAGDHYITENELDLEVRFDFITVLVDNERYAIEHYVDAFGAF